MPNPSPVVTVREIAEAKGVSRQAVTDCINRGTLTAYRSGGFWLVHRDEKLEAYLAAPPHPNKKA